MSTTVRIVSIALLALGTAAFLSGCKGFKTGFEDPTAAQAGEATHGSGSQSKPTYTPPASGPTTTWPYRESPSVPGGHKPVRRVQLVTFAAGSASLGTEATGALGTAVEELKANSRWNVLVVGFADKMGESSGGQALGQKRADAVAANLKSRGVPQERISVQSLGSSYAEGDQWSKESQKQDRRVEVWAFWE